MSYCRDQSKAAKHGRERLAADQFAEAAAAMEACGAHLLCRQQYKPAHYQVTFDDDDGLLNVYPSNQRLYWDKRRRGTFLDMPEDRDWTLMDIVRSIGGKAVPVPAATYSRVRSAQEVAAEAVRRRNISSVILPPTTAEGFVVTLDGRITAEQWAAASSAARIQSLEARIPSLEDRVEALERRNADLEERLAAMETGETAAVMD